MLPFPKVAIVSPGMLAPGTTANVTVTGRSFAGPIAVEVASDGGVPLLVGPPTLVSPFQIRVPVTVPAGSPAQSYDVIVKNLGRFPGDSGAQTTCYDCLQVG